MSLKFNVELKTEGKYVVVNKDGREMFRSKNNKMGSLLADLEYFYHKYKGLI